MKKVLVVHASAGAGHTTCALAIHKGLSGIPGISCECVDVLDYTNALVRWSYRRMYLYMVKYAPRLWSMVYYPLDIDLVYKCIRPFRTVTNRLSSRRFIEYLLKNQPDMIITTHFFPADIVSYLKREGIIKTRLVSVVTDFGFHAYWLAENADEFIVGGEALKNKLKSKGVEDKRINALGIPIDTKFYKQLNGEVLRKKFGTAKNLLTVLIASGGFGVGPVNDLVKELVSERLPLQLLVVCGRNLQLYNNIKALKNTHGFAALKVFGFVDYMDELMEISHLMISKSGGMTSSEAIAKEVPMIVISPIPGQEMRNCNYLVMSGAAVREDNVSGIKKRIMRLMDNREELGRMKESIMAIKKADANSAIAKMVSRL